MKLPKTLIRIGVVLLAVVAAVLVVRAAFDFLEGRRLARALAGLKGKGVPVTAGDLAAPCPDEDNAARLWKAIENIIAIDNETDGKLVGQGLGRRFDGQAHRAGRSVPRCRTSSSGTRRSSSSWAR